MRNFWRLALLFPALAGLLLSCGTSIHVTRIQELAADADAPYGKILVVSLFESFDARRYLEKELVQQLAALGIEAKASTSMMNSLTPVTRATFVAMLDEFDADALLVTQLVSAQADAKIKDQNPESTYNIRPTYYYNVWNVELTEYIEPPTVQLGQSIVLATQIYSVASQESVWTIESDFRIVRRMNEGWDYSIFPQEAGEITAYLARDGLIAP
jgi:hypothetical protein